MKKAIISLASVLLITASVVLIRSCSGRVDFGAGSAWIPRKPSRDRKVPPQNLHIRPGESKDDYWGRIADTQNYPIVFYGRVLDQDGKPLEGVEVLPKVHRCVSTAMRLAGQSEFLKCSPVKTDPNGLFAISGYRGFTVTFVLNKAGYRSYGGGVNCQPGFSQPGFPHGFEPNPSRPVEYQLLRADMPPNERIFRRRFRIAWNGEPITLDLGEAVGHLVVNPSRQGKNPASISGFNWSVRLAAEGFVLAPLEGNQPELRMAPVAGYATTFTAGAKAEDTPWLSGINRTFAIRTAQNRYGTMIVCVDSYDDEQNTPLWVTIYLGQPGMRNIVASECLRQFGPSGAPVHSYIAAQAALSSHVFGPATTPMDTLDPEICPNPYGYYWQQGDSAWPPQWQTDARPSYMAQQYMHAGVKYINHYNPFDWALAYGNWQRNQRLKPDNRYNYGPPTSMQVPLDQWRYRRKNHLLDDWFSHILNFPADRYEIFSYAARSWGHATGRMGGTGGVFDTDNKLNVSSYFRPDGEKAEEHKYHSGQFRSSIQKRWTYWDKTLKQMRTQTP